MFDEERYPALKFKGTTNRSQSIFMAMYSKESLELLRQRIDLTEVVSSHVTMQKSGASYKGLCPFHEERTPSFMIHKGDSHYHCFGCGAHGDAISFLMNYVKMTFVESLEYLSEKFQVSLEKVEEEEKGPNKKRLKAALEKASELYRFFLLHSEEGKAPLEYLYQRDIDLAFIRQFGIGYAPKQGDMILKLLKEEGFSEQELELAGLIRLSSRGQRKDFFNERILFPIRDRVGSVIGFSGRKFREETFGGKYVNTAETLLFKKSQTLFGFSYSRQKIAKERRVLIVEGQIDALRLIFNGFDFTVAGQGTAFGEGHVKELLLLGINHAYLALDADSAGLEAAIKIGDLLQSKGVEVTCLSLPSGSDPDSFLREHGKEAFSLLLSSGIDYLSFYYHHLAKNQDLSSPSQKNEIVEKIASRIRLWEKPVLVYESLKKLAQMAEIPQSMLGLEMPLIQPVKLRPVLPFSIDPDRILDMDLLRWMSLASNENFTLIKQNIDKKHFKSPASARLFEVYASLNFEERKDLMSVAVHLENQEEQLLLSELLQKKINLQRAEENVLETIKKILLRHWMEQKEEIRLQMQKEGLSEEEELDLAMRFNALNKQQPQVVK